MATTRQVLPANIQQIATDLRTGRPTLADQQWRQSVRAAIVELQTLLEAVETTIADDDTDYAALEHTHSIYQQILAEGPFVDGDKTKLDGIEALADVTDEANVTAAIEIATLPQIIEPADADQILLRDASDSDALSYSTFSDFTTELFQQNAVTRVHSQVDRPFTLTISDESGNDSPTTSFARFTRIGRNYWGGGGPLTSIDTTGLTGTDDVQISAPQAIGFFGAGTVVASTLNQPTGGLTFHLVKSDSANRKFKIATVGDNNALQYLTVADLTDDTTTFHTLTFYFFFSPLFDDESFDESGITFDQDTITWDAG